MRTKATLTNIKEFMNFHLYDDNGLIPKEKCEEMGLSFDNWESLNECAYRAAYDISEDWAKEDPEWSDVQEAYKIGVEDGINYIINILKEKCINIEKLGLDF